MTPEEARLYIRNFQNPGVIARPDGPSLPSVSIPSGDMLPKQPTPNALRRLNLRNPLAFDIPAVKIPNIDIPTKGNELLRAAGQQPKQLNYTGSSLNVLSEQSAPTIPPRPISGSLPTASSLNPVASPQSLGPTNASALAPNVEGGLRPPFASTQKPFIEGEFTRVSTPLAPYQNTGTPPNGSNAIPSSSGAGLSRVPPSALSRVVSAVAGSAVPTLAGSIAGQIQEDENRKDPLYGMSPKDVAFLAESNPEVYAYRKKDIDRILQDSYAKPSEPTVERGSDIDPLELTKEERARAERNRAAVLELFPEKGLQYGKYSNPVPLPGIPSAQEDLDRFNRMRSSNIPIKSESTLENAVSRKARGGFVGAATDAQAEKNIQDRLAQDEAAHKVAIGYDRATEALKSLRAEKLGIPRSALEPGANAQPDMQTRNPFSLPGDSFGDAEIRKNNMMSAINDPRATKAQRAAALESMKTFIEGNQPPPQSARAVVNPLDEQRFLLDQQRAGRQQVMDENRFLADQQRTNRQQAVDASRLAIDAANLQNNQAKTALEQKQYEDKVRADFMANATFTTPNVPTGQLAAIALDVAKATGLPPDVALSYVDKAAAQFDWKNGPPKNIMDIGTLATTLAAAERRGQ